MDEDEIVNPQSLSPTRRDEFNKDQCNYDTLEESKDNPELLEKRQRRMSEMSDQ